ncbi:hypothetical protein [Lacticaseibacillus paracasei]|uniref:hypothetical protein n=1 Tax=Lacticaseibacillus paracasei TaxID=1597 RepID=UPI0021A27AA9|nr:hypothetical protein [Lacticaseibacillus paracasei]
MKIIESEIKENPTDYSASYFIALCKLDQWLVYLNRRERLLVRPLTFCSENSVNFNVAIKLFCLASGQGTFKPVFYTIGDFGEIRLLADTKKTLIKLIQDPVDNDLYGAAKEDDIFLGYQLIETPTEVPKDFTERIESEAITVDLQINGDTPQSRQARHAILCAFMES